MTCYQNTQCIPTSLLCSPTSPCTDDDGDQDPDDPILCQDQLCVGVNFLPLPSPGFGKLDRSASDCWPGQYYSLFGETPKYTQSCVRSYVSVPTSCQPWEYLAQSSCFLSTCKDHTYCETPFFCVKKNSGDAYGICSNNGTQSGVGDGSSNGSGGGSAAKYSAQQYLVQGLLIGICCLALGVGLGVGFWHYRNKRRRIRRWTDTTDLTAEEDDRTPGASSVRQHRSSSPAAKGSDSILLRLLLCGRTRERAAAEPAVDNLAAYHENNTNNVNNNPVSDPESREGSLVIERRSSLLPPSRWRWAAGGGGGLRNMSVVPEFEPPPMYHNGPALPTYGDSTEDIALTSVRRQGGEDDHNHSMDFVHESMSRTPGARITDPASAVTNSSFTDRASNGQDLVVIPMSVPTTHSGTLTVTHETEGAAALRNGPPPLMTVESHYSPASASSSPAHSKPGPQDDPSSPTSSIPKSEK
ncbi:hypothetical protein BGZ83_011089 [Gryganskiella cystojenkinii]|nr:hypothetical protein BGZ83_011089 [Gryganskiella cystojenkinii]